MQTNITPKISAADKDAIIARSVQQKMHDGAASLTLGAVPGFLTTAFLACIYSVGNGLASAAGMSNGAAVATGIVGTVVFGGFGLGVGALAGGAGLFGLAASKPVRKSNISGKLVAVGAALGVAGSVALAHKLTVEDKLPAPVQRIETLSQLFPAKPALVIVQKP